MPFRAYLRKRSDRLLWVDSGSSPLFELNALNASGHGHGFLTLVINGTSLPSLGYDGSDDVCFNAWIADLVAIDEEFAARMSETYVLDKRELG